MSLMKRALDGVRRGLNQIGRNIAGAAVKSIANPLPGVIGGGKRTFLPVWTGAPRGGMRLPSPYVPKGQRPEGWKPVYVRSVGLPLGSNGTDKWTKRARDNEMRAGLPSMSGRQWKRVRKMLYRRAKALTLSQRQETTG